METTRIIGIIWGFSRGYVGLIGIMEKKMETTIVKLLKGGYRSLWETIGGCTGVLARGMYRV